VRSLDGAVTSTFARMPMTSTTSFPSPSRCAARDGTRLAGDARHHEKGEVA